MHKENAEKKVITSICKQVQRHMITTLYILANERIARKPEILAVLVIQNLLEKEAPMEIPGKFH